MQHDIKYFVLSSEPTAEQYAMSFMDSETVPQNPSKTKWLLKCGCEGIPQELSGEDIEFFDHDGFMRYAESPAWS
tara:strand:+ start:181 stop:405 length:225 start_codon:yes stop_codon:yes gene_type:complete